MILEEFPGIKINTTGGYASWLNGKIECPHETVEDGTRATLYDAGCEDKFWCYASTDVIKKYNCTLHSVTGDCPDFYGMALDLQFISFYLGDVSSTLTLMTLKL